jgi:2-iminobutanoate/2-iminopropanoate deaminase
MTTEVVSTDAAPPALGPYSQAVVAHGFVFTSGTAGIDPDTGVAPDDLAHQAELALRNLEAVLAAAGASLATLVKTTVFYADVDDFATLNAVYERWVPEPRPARSAPGGVRLPGNLLVSIDAIAALDPVGGS